MTQKGEGDITGGEGHDLGVLIGRENMTFAFGEGGLIDAREGRDIVSEPPYSG
ncbi:hypothetical protein [Photorhabdus stackebrandtii]|uniref:hypothetical protein n=1 Tax=Photorhabdus stackebrandtii TaxID=1123042 RepID=UPI00140A0F2F|nr:hypothetical protein [Photorhabdus stackebrandtii]